MEMILAQAPGAIGPTPRLAVEGDGRVNATRGAIAPGSSSQTRSCFTRGLSPVEFLGDRTVSIGARHSFVQRKGQGAVALAPPKQPPLPSSGKPRRSDPNEPRTPPSPGSPRA